LSAVKHAVILKAFYLKLRAAGKKPKVALVACVRKLVVLVNRLLKNPKFNSPTNTVPLGLSRLGRQSSSRAIHPAGGRTGGSMRAGVPSLRRRPLA
jgi:transposase